MSQDFALRAGETFLLDFGPITRLAAPVDLTLAATKLRLMAKVSTDDPDAAAKIDVAYNAGGVSSPDIVVNATGDRNTGEISHLLPEDLGGLTLRWEFRLLEPNGIETVIDDGYLRVSPAVIQVM